MAEDRDQQLTSCQGIRERKQVISGQNVTGQKSTTYSLSRHQRKKTGDQWTECYKTGIKNLPAVKASERKEVISGQNVTGQESTTYSLSRHQRKKTGDHWTECHGTGINNLHTVKASEKENR